MAAAITLTQTSTFSGFTLGALGVTGTGLADNATVTVEVGGVAVPVLTGGTTSASGVLAKTTFGPVPPQPSGTVTVTVNDGTNSPTASLTVTVQNPIRETAQSTSHTAYSTT
jgi:hypothetical protein